MLDIIMQFNISTRLSNNNHLSSHEKNIIKKRKKIQKIYGKLDQNPYVNKNDTYTPIHNKL